MRYIHKPDREFSEGMKVSASVIVMKTADGFKLLANRVAEV